MRAKDFILTERATSVVYHYTGTRSALKILSSGQFELSSVTGNKSEEQYAPKGYPFFLSLTRTPQGDYHRYVGTSGVLFKLNGDWFNQHYIVKPIDYWERSWLHSGGTRTREAEDRVFSKEPTIPSTPITEIHVLLKEQVDSRSIDTRRLLISAKQQGIPAYLYTDERAWRLLDKRRSVNPSSERDLLRGTMKGGYSRKPRDSVKPWIELITKDNESYLSDHAKGLLKNLRWYSYRNEDQNLGVDLSNARKPDAGDRESALWIIKYMQKNNFNSTVDLKNSIADKWNSILDKKQKVAESIEIPTIGINVRSDGDIDYADLIIDGKKKLETRDTNSLKPYIGKRVAIVKTGKGKAMAIGSVTVGEPIPASVNKFRRLEKFHLVPQGSAFDIKPNSTKYLYPMIDPVRFPKPREVGHGIIGRKVFEVEIDNKEGLGAVPYNQEIDYMGLRVKMKPSTFLKLASKLDNDNNEFIYQHIKTGGSIGAPFLKINIPDGWTIGDFTEPARVSNHEGRHRMAAVLKLEGDAPVEVHLFPRYHRNKHMTSEFIENLNKHLINEDGVEIQGPFFKV